MGFVVLINLWGPEHGGAVWCKCGGTRDAGVDVLRGGPAGVCACDCGQGGVGPGEVRPAVGGAVLWGGGRGEFCDGRGAGERP